MSSTPVASIGDRRNLQYPTQELEQETEPEGNGIYIVKGVTYYEGKKHESLLQSGITNCEVYVDVSQPIKNFSSFFLGLFFLLGS